MRQLKCLPEFHNSLIGHISTRRVLANLAITGRLIQYFLYMLVQKEDWVILSAESFPLYLPKYYISKQS